MHPLFQREEDGLFTFHLMGGQLARAAGAVAKLIAKEGKSTTLRLPSGESDKWVMSGQTRKVWVEPTIPMEVVKGGPRLVEKNPQLLGVIPYLEEGVGKGINIVIFLFFFAVNRKRKKK
ncbi:unnamed protein product [Victoria cruziana]